MRYAVVLAATAAIAASLAPPPAQAESEGDIPFAAGLAAELAALREEYESRIRALEAQIEALQARSGTAAAEHDDHDHGDDAHMHEADDDRHAHDHGDGMAAHEDEGDLLNPSITAVIRGLATAYSADESEIPGFPLGHEGERAPEGFSLDHSELVLASDVSDAVRGNLTLGIHAHPGEAAEVEVEEAYVRTLPGAGLPGGMSVKAGRALWTFGYLNERHAHEDDFADRSLPYRVYLDNAFNDDGIELSLALPSLFDGKIGGGLFRGDDYPFGGSDDGRRTWSAFAHFGGELGSNSSWRLGGSLLDGEPRGAGGAPHDHEEEEHAHEEGEDHEHEDHAAFFSEGTFTGDRQLFGVDAGFAWAPTGDARQSGLTLLGEYLWLKDSGTYTLAEEELEVEGEEVHVHEHEETLDFDGRSSGWYAQAVYRIMPEWRVGARYSRLRTPNEAEIGHDPRALAVMADWTDDRFGQVRLQYNREELTDQEEDDQVVLQYTVTLGSHGDHGHDH